MPGLYEDRRIECSRSVTLDLSIPNFGVLELYSNNLFAIAHDGKASLGERISTSKVFSI